MKTFKTIGAADFMNKKSEITRKKVITEMTTDDESEIRNAWPVLSKQIISDLASHGKFILGDIELIEIKEKI